MRHLPASHPPISSPQHRGSWHFSGIDQVEIDPAGLFISIPSRLHPHSRDATDLGRRQAPAGAGRSSWTSTRQHDRRQRGSLVVTTSRGEQSPSRSTPNRPTIGRSKAVQRSFHRCSGSVPVSFCTLEVPEQTSPGRHPQRRSHHRPAPTRPYPSNAPIKQKGTPMRTPSRPPASASPWRLTGGKA